MKLRIILASRLPLYILLIGLLSVHACKNKKKLTEVTDQEAVKEEIADELARNEANEESASEPNASEMKSVSMPLVTLTKSQMVDKYFMEITGASSVDLANGSIDKTLQFFSNPEVPVLIAIYQNEQEVDYDEPTNISKYLNYLKDTKSKPAVVEEMVMDENGKIKELILRKGN
ncbi:MAG: hypothetical protein ACI8QD_000662 [Cyclobacteriaceae bacterium]|jgi:hypothetical protein